MTLRIFPKISTSPFNVFGNRRPDGNQPAVPPRLLFVSHEASRTGAPLIILNLIRHFAAHCNVSCETILGDGGPIIGQFAQTSRVECLNAPRANNPELKRKVSKFLRSADCEPCLAICNSMESRYVGEELAAANIPVVYLVHELASSYTEEDFQRVFHYSKKVIFPAEIVRDAAHQKSSIPFGKGHVIPQGLLNPKFGKTVNREKARMDIRRELGLPADSFIVLGCGTLDLRKGIDHFAAIGRQLAARHSESKIYFVWVGDGPRWTHSPFHYVQLDLEKSNAQSRVRFIGERVDVEPYFLGSDMFLLTSRVDPFPCVIHEAMVSGLPIVTFDSNGGAAEALAGGAGIIIPYADYDSCINAIRVISTQPELGTSIREKAIERVETQYRFDDYAEKIIDLCELTSLKPLRKVPAQTRAA
jgi:glycosyltransferase involved in cell wall biosynthesis